MKRFSSLFILLSFSCSMLRAQSKAYDAGAIAAFKKQALSSVSAKEKQVQEMVDMIFSFAELGFQETETSRYLTDILTANGFSVEKGISGIPDRKSTR